MPTLPFLVFRCELIEFQTQTEIAVEIARFINILSYLTFELGEREWMHSLSF